jgi:hypothetical protein
VIYFKVIIFLENVLFNDAIIFYDHVVLVRDELMDMEQWCNINDRRKPNYWEKTSPSASFSTKNPGRTDLRWKPVFRGERPTPIY